MPRLKTNKEREREEALIHTAMVATSQVRLETAGKGQKTREKAHQRDHGGERVCGTHIESIVAGEIQKMLDRGRGRVS